jgi:hypothetical protein
VPEHKLRANIVRTLASRLQQSSVSFRRAQKEFLSKRAEQKRSAAGAGAGGGGAFDFLDEKPKATELVNADGGPKGFTLEQMEVVENMEEEIATRDHEINTLVSSIEELSQIFKELAVLVIDQGTILDRIDYNMEQVVEKVEDGIVELERAEELQKSARPRWCICILLTLIAVMLTLLILKHSPDEKKKKKNDDDDDDDRRRRRRWLLAGGAGQGLQQDGFGGSAFGAAAAAAGLRGSLGEWAAPLRDFGHLHLMPDPAEAAEAAAAAAAAAAGHGKDRLWAAADARAEEQGQKEEEEEEHGGGEGSWEGDYAAFGAHFDAKSGSVAAAAASEDGSPPSARRRLRHRTAMRTADADAS